MFPEEVLGLGVALGGGGLVGGAEVLWTEDLFFICMDPSLEVRLRRTNSGPDEGCSERVGALPGEIAGEQAKTSSWDSPLSLGIEGWTWFRSLLWS